ncbi:Syntaxin-8 [Bulinus truncatus]|nr:Syntaxin-8 [Bulinus truncatus]
MWSSLSGLLLMGATGSTDTYSRGDPWGMNDEPEAFRDMNNTDLHQQQKHIIREQDRGLEALSVIGRQKQMAVDIGNEVDSQNDLLDDIIDHTERTGSRIQRETRHIRIVDRKSASCCYYIVIILLLVAIIVIAAIPYKGKP